MENPDVTETVYRYVIVPAIRDSQPVFPMAEFLRWDEDDPREGNEKAKSA